MEYIKYHYGPNTQISVEKIRRGAVPEGNKYLYNRYLILITINKGGDKSIYIRPYRSYLRGYRDSNSVGPFILVRSQFLDAEMPGGG